MFYGIPLGLSMLVGSILGKFWLGVGFGLTLNLITFLWMRLPIIKTTLKKLGFPKIGGTPLKSTATWFWSKKMWVIMLILLTVLVYNGYTYTHPQDAVLEDVFSALQKNEDTRKKTALSTLLEKTSDGVPLTPEEESFLKQMREEANNRSVAGFAEDFFYSKTLELEVSTLQPHTLCGVRPGERMFSVPTGREVEVFIRDEQTGISNKNDITSAVRVNGTFAGEKFEIGSDGCAKISFAVNGDFQKNKFVRQVIALKFE